MLVASHGGNESLPVLYAGLQLPPLFSRRITSQRRNSLAGISFVHGLQLLAM